MRGLVIFRPCKKCGGTDRYIRADGKIGGCKPCAHEKRQTPEFKAQQKVRNASPVSKAARQRYSETYERLPQTPEQKRQQLDQQKVYLRTPEGAATREAYLAEYRARPETVAANLIASATYYASPKGLAVARSKTARRRARRRQATPLWADTPAHMRAIADLYAEAGRVGGEVDHMVPLAPCLVCGATGEHVIWNLQILTPRANNRKRNRCSDCWKAAS